MTMMINTERSNSKRIWKELVRDKIVFASLLFLVVIYATTLISGFLAPYQEDFSDRNLAYAPPTPIFVMEKGKLTWPYVVTYERRFDPDTYGFGFYPDYSKKYPVQFFTRGESYKLLGIIPSNVHLFGVSPPAQIFLLGTDFNGRDNFSRLLYGAQISLTIGFLGLLIAFPIGLIYGGISGYLGGKIDNTMMRLAEIIMSIPSFYLLISLAAILPAGLSSKHRFALIVAILAFIGWAGMSRVIRGMVLSIKEYEFIEASRSLGAGSLWIIVKHVLPQTATYFIIAATLNVPGYLLAESGLSFLGLGIQPPDASWGNMLREAQDLTNIMLRPWLLLAPGLLIFFTILSFNVFGDKLRDILDPKSYQSKA